MKRNRTMPLKRVWVHDSDLFGRYGKQLTERQQFVVKVVLLVVKDFKAGQLDRACEISAESDFEAGEFTQYERAMGRLWILGERGF